MKKITKIVSLLLAILLLTSVFAACFSDTQQLSAAESSGSAVSTAKESTTPESSTAPETFDTGLPYEGVMLKWTMAQTASQGAETQALINLVKERTGITIEANLVPESVDGQIDKTLVGLMAGDEMDIVYYATPRLKPFINAGVLTSLDDVASNAGYDMEKIYGSYLPVFSGEVWGLPAFSDIWLTLYNKKVFDNVGVDYPTANGWTWDKYIETAKQLTDVEKGVYGSLMLDYNCYNYMLATQKGAAFYKDDGLSNFDDPVFKDALKFFYDLGNEDKIQPSMLEFKAGGVPWDAFFSQDAEYGMFVCGGWTLQVMAEAENYPRDWQFGVLPMPYPEGEPPSTLTVPGCYAIPSTSKNVEAAFAAISVIAEEQYTLGYGRVPARVDLTGDEISSYIENELVKPYEADGITVEDIRTAWFDSNRIAYDEKVIGSADAEINNIWVEEGQLYGQHGKDLDTAIASIKERSDRAIEESGERAGMS